MVAILRFSNEIIAFKLKEDLIAEAGLFVVVSANDNIEILTEDQWTHLFTAPPTVPLYLFQDKSSAVPVEKANGRDEDPQPPMPPFEPKLEPEPPVAAPQVPIKRWRIGTEVQIIQSFGPTSSGEYMKNMPLETIQRLLPRTAPALLLERVSQLIRSKKISVKAVNGQFVYSLLPAGEKDSRDFRARH